MDPALEIVFALSYFAQIVVRSSHKIRGCRHLEQAVSSTCRLTSIIVTTVRFKIGILPIFRQKFCG